MKTMAEVVESLAKWMFESEWGGAWEDCHESAKPGWIRSAQSTLDFLTAAGFGPVKAAASGALREAGDERDERSDTLLQTMQNMADSRKCELADIVRYGAFSAEARSTAAWLRARAASIEAQP